MIVDSNAIDKGLKTPASVESGCSFVQKEIVEKIEEERSRHECRICAPRSHDVIAGTLPRLYHDCCEARRAGAAFRVQTPSGGGGETIFNFRRGYHISRFFHFSEANGDKYSINGEIATHVAIDPEIASIL